MFVHDTNYKGHLNFQYISPPTLGYVVEENRFPSLNHISSSYWDNKIQDNKIHDYIQKTDSLKVHLVTSFKNKLTLIDISSADNNTALRENQTKETIIFLRSRFGGLNDAELRRVFYNYDSMRFTSMVILKNIYKLKK